MKDYSMKQIKEQINKIEIAEEIATFSCHSDHIITYDITKDTVYYQFCIIADETFMRDMKVSELLELKRISYFEFSVFIRYASGRTESISTMHFRPLRSSQLN